LWICFLTLYKLGVKKIMQQRTIDYVAGFRRYIEERMVDGKYKSQTDSMYFNTDIFFKGEHPLVTKDNQI
jgi:hypothetical protein